MESKTIHWEIQIQPTEEFMTNKKITQKVVDNNEL